MADDYVDHGLVLGEAVHHQHLKKKMLIKTEFRGCQYLQFKEEWRTSENEEWNPRTKKVVSFSREEFVNFVNSLERKGVKTFRELLMIFNEEDTRNK